MGAKYIVQNDGGNPRILQRNDSDGTYATLTHGAGEKSIEDLAVLVDMANEGWGED